jgi:uncharacterized membrane protein
MTDTSLQPRALLAAGSFVLATTALLVLVFRLITSPSIVVTLGGETVYAGTTRPTLSLVDTVALTTMAFVSGVSASVLLFEGHSTSSSDELPTESRPSDTGRDHDLESTNELLEARRREWEETADRLANTERTVYEVVLEADGVLPQSEIVEKVEFSKATVSRTLDTLEAKELIERKRRGVGNVVLLQ